MTEKKNKRQGFLTSQSHPILTNKSSFSVHFSDCRNRRLLSRNSLNPWHLKSNFCRISVRFPGWIWIQTNSLTSANLAFIQRHLWFPIHYHQHSRTQGTKSWGIPCRDICQRHGTRKSSLHRRFSTKYSDSRGKRYLLVTASLPSCQHLIWTANKMGQPELKRLTCGKNKT